MAQVLSGSFNTTAYSGRYLVLSWTATQDIANNKTAISWTLKGAGGSTTGYYKAGNFKVVIAGETVYSSSARINLYNGTVVASGSKVIVHNNNGTKSFTASAEAGIYYVAVNCKGSGSWELKDIPRGAKITSAPDFTDTENPKITFKNPLGSGADSLQACISFDGSNDDIAYRAVTKTATSYTFRLTTAQRKILRQGTVGGVTRTVYFYLKTVIGDNTFYSKVAKTLTITDCAPIIAPTVVDTGSNSTQLTGDANIIISGYNYIKAEINATAQKEAAITSFSIVNAGNIKTESPAYFPYVQKADFVFTATDNRKQTTKQTITKTIIPYFKPTINLAENKVLTDGTYFIDLSGQFYNGSFGAVNNSISVEFKWRVSGAEWSDWQALSPTINGNNYTAEATINGLDYRESYDLQCRVVDAVGGYNAAYIADTGVLTVTSVPVFDWGKEDFAFNVPISIEGQPLNDFIIDRGTNGIWNYCIYKSGIAVCWGYVSVNTAITSAWGSMYVGTTKMSKQSYPFTFKSKPVEVASVHSANNAVWLFAESGATGTNSTTQSAVYNICRPSAITASSNYHINIIAYGYLE